MGLHLRAHPEACNISNERSPWQFLRTASRSYAICFPLYELNLKYELLCREKEVR